VIAMTEEIAKSNPGQVPAGGAEDAIGTVLRAEREARQAIEGAREEATRIAETARTAVRTVAERTERRIRAAGAAFDRELAGQLAAIERVARRESHSCAAVLTRRNCSQ
jgi:vacuolar-type H+-ATPase subunit H